WPIGGVDLGENTSITSTDDPLGEGEVARIRMTLLVNNATFPESTESFKLQYGKRDGPSCAAISIWTDVGAPGSGEVWRGYDGTPADGDEVPSTLISIADIAASYEESNNSAVNPNVADPGDDVEFDWTIEHNGATQRTDYCFRMVKSDGAELQTYNNYPTLRTTGYTPVSNNWRWFGDEVSETPSASLASENVAPVDVVQGDIVKLRVGVKEVENASGANVKFALQYSEYSDFSQAVYTLTATSSCVGSSTWCYADGAGVDNAVISTTTISGVDACTLGVGNGCGMHNESANVGASPHAQPANSEMEFEFTLQHVAARANAVYYFRLYDITNDDPVVASSTYPS
ncbi:hypothetical protein KC906_02630, partial [Candidatus Kaiserbacteria bacterium]|nr:hypothetical protein [Candidatus Kaiserbacteria bacterium]